MPRRDLTFRVFVSSTFSDFKSERNALQAITFPNLQRYCAERGARFLAIDLRWGVSEEASFDQQTMRICLQELQRSQHISPKPNFLLLLGDRYGWRPLPTTVPADELESLRRFVPQNERNLIYGDTTIPAWHDDHRPDRRGWYRKDENAKEAEYVLQARTINYPTDASSADCARIEKDELNDWQLVEKRIRTALSKAVAEARWPIDDPRRIKYEDSATHQEIRLGALQSANVREHVFAHIRTIDGLPADSLAEEYRDLLDGSVDVEAKTRLDAVKNSLRDLLGSNVSDYRTEWHGKSDLPISTEHLQLLCTRVEVQLKGVIEHEIKKFQEKPEIDREIESHREFGQARGRHFTGRAVQLARIITYVTGNSTSPLVVHGVAGSGKTALMASAAEQLVTNESTRLRLVMSRFVGATPGSSDLISLLASLCQQLEPDQPVPTELSELVREFPVRLGRAAEICPLVVLLDALDQLAPADGAPQLRWLPWQLPAGVKMVVSVLDAGGADGECGRAAIGLGEHADRVQMDVFRPAEAEELLTTWLTQAGRTLQTTQRLAVLGTKTSAVLLPLQLKLAFEEARGWRSYEPLQTLNADVPGLVAAMLGRFENERHHGRVVTSRALGYLAAGRNGLTEEELLDVLSADPEVLADFRRRFPRSPEANRLPTVIWSRLRADLEPYLSERRADGARVIGFYHRQIAEVAAERYLGNRDRRARHAELARYFGRQALWSGPTETVRVVPTSHNKGAPPNTRKVAELPYQLTLGERWTELQRTLCDFAFIEAKLRSGLGFQLKSDFDAALRARELVPIARVQDAFLTSFAALHARPHLTIQSLFNHFAWLDDTDPTLVNAVEAARRRLATCAWWISSGSVPSVRAAATETTPFEITSSIQSLAPSGRAIAVAGIDGSAEIVDVPSGARLHRRGPDRHHVRALLLSDDRALLFVHADGSIRSEFGTAAFAGRPGESLLVQIPGRGVVVVRADNSLVMWDPQNGTESVLVANLPEPLVSLRVSRDGSTVLYVAGQKTQQLGTVRVEEMDTAWVLSWTGPRILDADIDPTGRHLVLSTLDRRLRILDARMWDTIAEVPYEEETEGVIKGPVQKCRLAADADSHRVLFATPTGQVADWDWKKKTIERLEDYASNEARETVAVLEWIFPPDRGLLSTSMAMRVFVAGSGSHGRQQHETAVTACAVAPGRRVVSIGVQDHSVRWFDCQGLRPLGQAYCRRPTAIATTDDPDVYIGTEEGCVWKFRLGSPEPRAELIASGFGPIASLLVENGGAIIVADRSGSTLRGSLNHSGGTFLQFTATGYRHRKTLAARNNLFVSWGEDGLIDSVQSVVSLLPGKGVALKPRRPIPPTWKDQGNAQAHLVLYSSTDILRDVAVSPDGTRLCLAGEQVEIRPVTPTRDEDIYLRSVAVVKAAFLTDDLLAVVLDNEKWIEIWRVGADLPTLAAIDIEGPVASLGARGEWLVVGSKSGQLRSAHLEGSARTSQRK